MIYTLTNGLSLCIPAITIDLSKDHHKSTYLPINRFHCSHFFCTKLFRPHQLHPLLYSTPHVDDEGTSIGITRYYVLLAKAYLRHRVKDVLVKGESFDRDKFIFVQGPHYQNAIHRGLHDDQLFAQVKGLVTIFEDL